MNYYAYWSAMIGLDLAGFILLVLAIHLERPWFYFPALGCFLVYIGILIILCV
jgi:hypothetical protein